MATFTVATTVANETANKAADTPAAKVESKVDAKAAEALFEKYGCNGCHGTDTRILGPSLKEVGAKYKGDKSAASLLVERIKKGNSGVWGAIPMPPNDVPDVEIKKIVDWVLAP